VEKLKDIIQKLFNRNETNETSLMDNSHNWDDLLFESYHAFRPFTAPRHVAIKILGKNKFT